MTTISMQRVIDGALESADTATLEIVNWTGATVLVPTVVVPASEGVYTYTTSYLPAGRYTANWIFIVAGQDDDVVSRVFEVDSPLETSEGITLMDLERLIARRCGQYRKYKSGAGSTQSAIQIDKLISSRNLGSFETEYVLRRGLYWDGQAVDNFVEDDRSRGLVTYTPTAGQITVDRSYTTAPATNELLELMYLDPEEELRPCAIEGLERCFFWDTSTLSYSGLGTDIDVTAALPWLTNPSWIKRMQYSLSASRLPPNRVRWFEPYRSGRSVMLRSSGVAPGSITITALRPHKSLVNGELSYAGPNDDLDVLYVDPDYAAWAGVLKVWENHPERMAPVAAQGMRRTLKEASEAFTTKSLEIIDQEPEFIRHRWGSQIDITQVGNLAEPVA